MNPGIYKGENTTNKNTATFSYNYSASTNKEVQRIRNKYLPREESKLDELKRLDNCVQSAGMIQSLSLGIVGILLFGVGMCAGLGVIGGGTLLAVILCLLGTAAMLPAYPVWRMISKKAKEKYAPRILQLADELSDKKI